MEKANKGKDKIISIIVLVIIVIGLLGAGIYFYKSWQWKRNPVGVIDSSAIYNTTEFTKAREKLEKDSQDLYKKCEEDSKNQPNEKKREIFLNARNKVEAEGAALILPLKNKASAAISIVANKRHMSVILDKTMVVTGAPDITEEVLKLFEGNDKLTPVETDKNNYSPIGYFNAEVIKNLKPFQDAEADIYKTYMQYQGEIKEAASAKSANKEAVNKLMQEKQQSLLNKRSLLYEPLNNDLNRAISETGKQMGLSLVVDGRSVMFGGLDITDNIVQAFTKTGGK